MAEYECRDPDTTCPEDCVGLDNCESCGCATVDTEGGPWGNVGDVIMCLLPIFFLLVATLKPKPLPTTVSLPLAALFMFLIRLMYLGSDPLLTCGSVISGLHEALTPLSIMAGAIFLFETMESTYCMPYIMREMKALTKGHAVTELMLLFSFAYMMEGACGFGTPAALGAPMLASLGHPKFESVVVLLLMNTFATVWGAVGTPLWFGFGNLGLSDADFLEISYQAGVCVVVATYILMPFVCTVLVPFAMIKTNWKFMLLSLSSCMLPVIGLSFASYEFPALLGGMAGCVLTSVLIKFGLGLVPVDLTKDEVTGRHPLDIRSTSKVSIVSDENLKNTSRSVSLDVVHEATHEKEEDDEKSWKEENEGSRASWKGKLEESKWEEEEKKNDEGDEGGSDLDEFHDAMENGVTSTRDSQLLSETDRTILSFDQSVAFSAVEDCTASLKVIQDVLGPRKKVGEGYIKELILRTFPLWGTVVLLIVSRIPQIGLREVLQRTEPSFSIYFGTYGIFKMSASLVLQLLNILTYPNLNWKYELLYTPFIIPFVLVSLITVGIYRKQLSHSVKSSVQIVAGRLVKPAVALFGALVLVQLLIRGDEASPAFLIGSILAEALKAGWIAIAGSIGTLGSFFSGSTTISNLTFGNVQLIAAEKIGTSVTAMLGLQVCGASAGNGVCINNIISACAVVGLTTVREGKVIAKTWKFVLAYVVIATLVMLAFLFPFE